MPLDFPILTEIEEKTDSVHPCSQVLVKALIPWIIQKIPHVCKLLIIFLLFACGLLMLVVSPDTSVRLAGMSVAEVAGAVAEMTFLSQTAFYSHTTTSAFAAGIGVGSVIGALYYTGRMKDQKQTTH